MGRWDNLVSGVGLTVIAIIGAALIYVNARAPGKLSPGAEECRRNYRRAHTRADSLMVDAQWPSTGPAKDPNAPTCRMLRLTGQLR